MKQGMDILIVDDVLENLQLLTNMLHEFDYKVRPALSGKAALKAIEKKLPDLILLDIKMPEMDGYEVCRCLKRDFRTQHIPVLFISALDDVQDKVKAFEVGGVDYINKPFQFAEVQARIATHLQLKLYRDDMKSQVDEGVEKIKLLTKDLIDSQSEIIFTMGEICETRSPETGLHIKRMSEFSYLLATLAGNVDAYMLKQASSMHDIGKVAIPDDILNKPGKLTPNEFMIMQNHSALGHSMLSASDSPLLVMAATVAYEHHEKWDGSGYPRGIKENEISLEGRIVAIADVFDALTHQRCYKAAWSIDEVLKYFKQQRGLHFDPELIDVFFESLDEFLKIYKQY